MVVNSASNGFIVNSNGGNAGLLVKDITGTQQSSVYPGQVACTSTSGTSISFEFGNELEWSQAGANSVIIQPYGILGNYIQTLAQMSGTIMVDTGGNAAAQTTSVTVVAITAPELSTYSISGYLNVVSVTTDVIQEQVKWTDENSTAQTQIFIPVGLSSGSVSTTGFKAMQNFCIRAKSGTTITISTTLTTSSGSISYDVGGNIAKIK